jgi:hypothetical protein
MKRWKLGLLAVVAAGTVLGLGGGLIHPRGAQAQAVTLEGAGITCQPAAGDWTDCTVTLSQGIPAGGSITAALGSRDAELAFCGDEGASGALCTISGNAAVFACPNGCGAGTQLALSALGESTATLAQNFTLVSSVIIDQCPDPLQVEANAAATGR